MKKIAIIAIIILIIDQVLKLIINGLIPLNDSINIIDNFFKLTYVHNYGAAFSILSGNRFFLIAVGIFTLFLIFKIFIKDKNLNKFETILYGFLIGGILGNLIDRIILGYVVDYLDFNIFGYNFAIFNFADIFIVSSAILLVINIMGEEEHEKINNK